MSKSSGELRLDDRGNLITKRPNGRLRVVTLNDQPSLTIQSDREGCDLRAILERFKVTGVLAYQASGKVPFDGDYINAPSFEDAQNMIARATASFEALPSSFRKRFGNDPVELIKFLDDPLNRDEAVKLGLVKAPVKEPEPTPPPKEGDG
jgi:phage internal scaffolding protein